MIYLTITDNDNVEKIIKRFKRTVEREGVIKDWKKKEFFEKPSTIKNRKEKSLRRKIEKKRKENQNSKS